MKTSHRLIASRGFTLIELLIVVGIIGILAGLAVPAANGVLKKAKKVRTQAALKDIQLGIKNYQVEYNRYPARGGSTSEEPVKLTEGSELLKVLLGEEKTLNPREIKYIDPPIGRNRQVRRVGNTHALVRQRRQGPIQVHQGHPGVGGYLDHDLVQ